MKSEHRHELKTNDLGQLTLKVGHYFEQYGNQILLSLAAGFLVAGGIIWFFRSSKAEKQLGWTDYAAAQTAEQYADVADKFEGTDVGAWARLSAGESHLESGIQMAFTDRAASNDELEAARKSFDKLLNSKTTPQQIRERALIGMARCQEATSDGNNQPAIETYQQFLKEFPDSMYKSLAQKRVDQLSTGSAQDFYAWFHQQNPKPEDRTLPRDLQGRLPAGHPEVDPFKGMSDAFRPTGIDRWMFPETVPDLLTVPGEQASGPELPPAPTSTDGAASSDGAAK